MISDQSRQHSLWDLTVLCFLREGAMHPYQLQRLVRERHTDEVLVLRRGSLYHAVNRLQRAGLIEAVGTSRGGRRPERTVYRITDEGEREMMRWLRSLVAIPQRETPVFMAAVSYLVYLEPEEAIARLGERSQALDHEIARLDSVLEAVTPHAGRINLLETEYARVLRASELEWIRAVVRDICSGQLSWDIEAILEQVRAARGRSEAAKESQT